jgi:GT2 family glycosyltransferase
MDKATGEVLVFLQDFILIPDDALDQIVTLYRKNPDCLQALPDMYFEPKVKPDKEKEDWFNGNTDLIGKFIRKNIRIQNQGLRFTENPMDFEQNYGAIPLKIVKELGGWHEWLDEGLGWDNTDLSWRALKKGYKILLDETNIAVCIDHWETLKGSPELGLQRGRRLNDPRFYFMKEMVEKGKMSLVRTQAEDDKIELLYEMPKEVSDADTVKWIRANLEKIVDKWIKEQT